MRGNQLHCYSLLVKLVFRLLCFFGGESKEQNLMAIKKAEKAWKFSTNFFDPLILLISSRRAAVAVASVFFSNYTFTTSGVFYWRVNSKASSSVKQYSALPAVLWSDPALQKLAACIFVFVGKAK